MMNVVAYARFSSDNQRTESIDAQIRAIKDYCKKNRYNLTHIYVDEAISATTDKRDEFQNMIRDSKNGLFDAVIVHKLDRFARNRYDSAIYKKKLKDNGVRVLSVLENLDSSPESVILESVLEGMNEYYSKNLAREVRKGLNENALKCIHNGGIPPLGYDVVDKHYVINESEAQAVRLIFRMYCDDYGYRMIAAKLNELGLRTKLGKLFSVSSIHDILVNEKYRGIYVWNKRKSKKTGNRVYKDDEDIVKIEGGMPRIIDDNLFFKAQEKNSTKLKPRKNVAREYILTGKVFCKQCGYAYCGGYYTKRKDGTVTYRYTCVNQKNRSGCHNKGIDAEMLEKETIRIIQETFLNDESINELVYSVGAYIESMTNIDNSAQIKDLEKELGKIKNRQDKLLDLYLDGNMTINTLNSKSEELEQQKSLIISQLSELKSVESIDYSSEEIKAFLMELKENEQVKRTLIDTFLESIYIDENDIILNLYLKTTKIGGGEGNRTPVQK